MIEIKVGEATFYKGCHMFRALTVFKNLERLGQEPTANGDPKAMIRWQCVIQNL